jgi:hypothetical protein
LRQARRARFHSQARRAGRAQWTPPEWDEILGRLWHGKAF